MKLKQLFKDLRELRPARKLYRIKPAVKFEIDEDYQFVFIPTFSWQPWPYRYPGCYCLCIGWLNFYVGIGIWERRDGLDFSSRPEAHKVRH